MHVTLYVASKRYSTLTPIAQPGCMRYSFVAAAAVFACSAEANVTRNDFAPAFGDGCEDGNEPEYAAAFVKPGYLSSAAGLRRGSDGLLSVQRAQDLFRRLWWQI